MIQSQGKTSISVTDLMDKLSLTSLIMIRLLKEEGATGFGYIQCPVILAILMQEDSIGLALTLISELIYLQQQTCRITSLSQSTSLSTRWRIRLNSVQYLSPSTVLMCRTYTSCSIRHSLNSTRSQANFLCRLRRVLTCITSRLLYITVRLTPKGGFC